MLRNPHVAFLAIEGISNPAGVRTAFGGAHGDNVEATGMFCPATFLQQEKLGCLDQLLLFAQVYALECAAPCGMAPVPNLDEYYCIAIEHDQIKLAAAAAPVAAEQA